MFENFHNIIKNKFFMFKLNQQSRFNLIYPLNYVLTYFQIHKNNKYFKYFIPKVKLKNLISIYKYMHKFET